MQKIAPGLYMDGPDLRLDIPELLRHFDVADTPANRDTCTRVALEILRQEFPVRPQFVAKGPGGCRGIVPAEQYEREAGK
jgi:hypothetical protein